LPRLIGCLWLPIILFTLMASLCNTGLSPHIHHQTLTMHSVTRLDDVTPQHRPQHTSNLCWILTMHSAPTLMMPPNKHIGPHLDHGTQEDPFMYIDARGNWHIINHAYDVHEWQNCGNSTLSAHSYSTNGKDWHMLKPNVEPYHHTVQYDDGTSPNPHLNLNSMRAAPPVQWHGGGKKVSAPPPPVL
jgi:hypothetical protein